MFQCAEIYVQTCEKRTMCIHNTQLKFALHHKGNTPVYIYEITDNFSEGNLLTNMISITWYSTKYTEIQLMPSSALSSEHLKFPAHVTLPGISILPIWCLGLPWWWAPDSGFGWLRGFGEVKLLMGRFPLGRLRWPSNSCCPGAMTAIGWPWPREWQSGDFWPEKGGRGQKVKN